MVKHELTPAFKTKEEQEELEKEQDWVEDMEDGGFTVVMPTTKTGKTTTDGVNSVPIATKITEGKQVTLQTSYMNKRKKKEKQKNDFYIFQSKHLKKNILIDLKRGFEDDLKKIEQYK